MSNNVKTITVLDMSAILIAGIQSNTTSKWNVECFPTGGIYRTVSQIARKLTKDNIIIMAFDKKPYIKSSIYPDFKGDRLVTNDVDREIFKLQMDVIKNYFGKVGTKIVEFEGYEADDISYSIAKEYGGREDIKIEIITADKDQHSAVLFGNNIKVISNTDKSKVDGNPNQLWDKFFGFGARKDNIPKLNKVLSPSAFAYVQNLYYSGETRFNDAGVLRATGLFTEEDITNIVIIFQLAMPMFIDSKIITGILDPLIKSGIQYDTELFADTCEALSIKQPLKGLPYKPSISNAKRIQDNLLRALTKPVIEKFEKYRYKSYASIEKNEDKLDSVIEKVKNDMRTI